jgi:MGT family glycosyltransferase
VSRILFVVPPLAGHAAPAAAVAAELARRGHETAWVASPGHLRRVLPAGARVYEAPPAAEVAEQLARPIRGGIWESLRAVWFGVAFPLARDMAVPTERALDDFEPDAAVVDQHALAGALACRRRGLPWATSAATPQATSAVVDAIGGREWLDERIGELQREAGAEPVAAADLSPHLVLVYSVPELSGGRDFPASYRFVGPPLHDVDGDAEFPWDELAEGVRIYVTLGTTASRDDARFYATAFEALAGEPLQAVVVGPPEAMPPAPGNALVRPWVPQLGVIRSVDAVVCHGGSNTVGQALAHGRPLVVAPDSFERGLIAAQVVEAGAAVRVRFARLRASELREAVRRVLEEPSFRRQAERVGEALRAAGGARAAADAVEELAAA